MGDVVADFAVALEGREESAVGDMGWARFEIEETAPQEVLPGKTEDVA